jgi:U3 small nucleolar RNA-associated protein 20
MYLLADSLKGVQRGFHSSAIAILQELLAEVYRKDHARLRTPPLEPILSGVLTASIHHTDADNFGPLLDVLVAQIESAASDQVCTGLSSRLLFVACGVRQGSRIQDWKPVLRCTDMLVKSCDGGVLDAESTWDALSAVSAVFQYCPLDAAIPYEKLLEGLTQGAWTNYFLPFCNLFASLGADRFRTLLLPYFKRCAMVFPLAVVSTKFVKVHRPESARARP